MCTFDSPIARCEAMHVMVLTDETQRACAAEHGCPPGLVCPLAAVFTGEEMVEGRRGPLSPPADEARRVPLMQL